MGRLGPRFALEALFLILVAVGLAVADVRPLVIVLVMAGAWLLVSLLELIASRQPRFAPLIGPVEVVTAAPQPETEPPPEPVSLVSVDTEPGLVVAEDEVVEPAVAPTNGPVVAEREEELVEVPPPPATAQEGAEVAPLQAGPAPPQDRRRWPWPFGPRRRGKQGDVAHSSGEPQGPEVAEEAAAAESTEDGSGAQGGTLEGEMTVESAEAEEAAPSVSAGGEGER